MLEENEEDEMARESNYLREKRNHVNNILHRKASCVGRILRINFHLHVATKGQMTEVNGVGRRRITQLLDDLRIKRRFWEIEEETEDQKRWKRQFIYQI